MYGPTHPQWCICFITQVIPGEWIASTFFETSPWDSYLHTLAQHGGYRRPWVWTEAIACLHGVRRMEDSCSRLAAESYFERLANLVATKAKTWESVLLCPLQHDLFVRTAPDSWRSPTCACTSLGESRMSTPSVPSARTQVQPSKRALRNQAASMPNSAKVIDSSSPWSSFDTKETRQRSMAGVAARCVTKTEAVEGIPSPRWVCCMIWTLAGALRCKKMRVVLLRTMKHDRSFLIGIVDSCSMSLFLNDALGFIAILPYQTS